MLPFFLAVIIRSNWRCVHLITTRYEVLWEPYQRYHAVSDIQYVSLPQGYTAVALRLNDVSVPVVDWCFFCTDWLILLSKHWLTDNAVICSLEANHRPADTETHECIMKGDDGGDWWVLTQGRNRLSILCACVMSGCTSKPRHERGGAQLSRSYRQRTGHVHLQMLEVRPSERCIDYWEWEKYHLYGTLDIAPVLMTPCHLLKKVLNMGP